MKLLTLVPSPRGFWRIYRYSLGHLDLTRMHHFSFPQYFDPIHVPLQSLLKFHLAINSLPSLSLKLHLELSFPFFSFYNLLHFSSFRITLSRWLTMTTPVALGSDILLRRAPLWILDCIMLPGHTEPPPEYASSHLCM